ncbi:hypothetical protein FB451DRAFT_1516146 [Mycena latifolia]|nr:hypothetical protein FB451DRAFT_1516146 [Mycena latifolia]
MPEIIEVLIFIAWIQWFILESKTRLDAGALKVKAIWTEVKGWEKTDMAQREVRVLEYGDTLCDEMLHLGFHRAWAVRLERLANAVPDTHGHLIAKNQLSPEYTCWAEFRNAICALEDGMTVEPAELPKPWYDEETAAGFIFDMPSNSGQVIRLNKYVPPTWRGPDPDRRLTEQRPPPNDREWEDQIEFPTPDVPMPCLFHKKHGDVLGPVAPPTLAKLGSSKIKTSRKKKTAAARPTKNGKLSSFGFTTESSPPKPSVAGISTKLESMGIKKTTPTKLEDCTDKDIDRSLYLWPSYILSELDKPGVSELEAFSNLDLELVGVEYDARDIILDLKGCYLEVEPLLHTSPQIFRNDEWEGVTRIPGKDRGFKVVMALELQTHTIAWLSHDNNCHIYWFTREDMDRARPGRVPDILLDYWNYCNFVVKWLKKVEGDKNLDMRAAASVICSAGNQPWRAVGRYSLDEIAARAGIPLWELWHDFKKKPEKIAATVETTFSFVWEKKILSKSKELNKKIGSDSFLLITTKDQVLRQLHWDTSDRNKRAAERYNRLSIRSYETEEDVMVDAPWVFDLAELAPTLLLFGHMGPAITGSEKWAHLYETEAEAATTADMRTNFAKNLPASLSEVQRLMFKPAVDLTPGERVLLVDTYGDDVNPLVRYLEQQSRATLKGFTHHPSRSAPARSAPPRSAPSRSVDAPIPMDIDEVEARPSWAADMDTDMDIDNGPADYEEEDDRRRRPIGLVDDIDEVEEEVGEEEEVPENERFVDPAIEKEEEQGFDNYDGTWDAAEMTLIRDTQRRKIPTRVCKSVDGSAWTVLKPPKRTTNPDPTHKPNNAVVFKQFVEMLRVKMTLRQVKASSRLYTVGPMDFCGHAKAIQFGKRCDQLREIRAWETIGTWRPGMQKLSAKAMSKEKNLRAKARKDLKVRRKGRRITDQDVAVEVGKLKALRRKLKLEAVAKAEAKARAAEERAKKKAIKMNNNAKGKGKGKR